VKPGGQKKFSIKSKNTKLVAIPKSKHEIFNATTEIRREYYHKIFDFIEEGLV